MTNSTTTTLTPQTLRIICTSLGLEVTDLEELFGVAHRTVTRWMSNTTAPAGVQKQIRAFQAAVSAHNEAALTEIDEALGADPADTVVVFARYPIERMMPGQDSDDQIWLHSPRTWDAMLGRLLNTLTEQGVTAQVVTVDQPAPLYTLHTPDEA